MLYPASSYASAVLGVVILSVCLSISPSVCHTRTLWQNQTMHCGYFDTARKCNHSSFLTPTVVGRWCPFLSEICEKRRLRQISAYNVSTVSGSEKSSIMTNRKSATGFPTSYGWSAYVTPKSLKGRFNNRFFCFLIQFNFNWRNSATKFFCEKTSSGIVVV